MRFELFISILLSFWLTPVIAAESVQNKTCSRQAIEEENDQYLQELSNYISVFINQNNLVAVDELNKIKPKNSFKKKYAKEIKSLNDPNYQPTQEFCDDVFLNFKELKLQVEDIIKKYNYSNE